MKEIHVLILDLIEANPAGCIISLKTFLVKTVITFCIIWKHWEKYQNEMEYCVTGNLGPLQIH